MAAFKFHGVAFAVVAAALVVGTSASNWGDGPASFDCAMRKLAYTFGRQQIPRMGDFESLYYALDLNSPDCNATMESLAIATEVKSSTTEVFPTHALYVHPTKGDDTGSGEVSSPLKTIQVALDRVADTDNANKTVVLRGGTYYLEDTIQFTPRHSHIRLVGMPGETSIVSGGVKLNISMWKPYNVSTPPPSPPAPPSPAGGWVVEDGYNYVWDAKFGPDPFPLYGKLLNATACAAACKSHPDCHAWTWHDANNGPSYSLDCVGRTDGKYDHRKQSDHTSGHDATAVPTNGPPGPSPSPPAPPAGPPNVWVANVGGQVSSFTGMHFNGKMATRARYPNLPGGLEVSCGYGCMISGGQAKWTAPDPNKYGPVKFYTDETPQHHRNDTDDWFNNYMIGTDGLCSVYDPPVSYWCSEHPSGGGAFAFRTPAGVTADESVLPHSPYKNASEAVFFVWRPSRWANWMFEVADHDDSTGKFTFGRGGNQGARGDNNGGDFFVENLMEELDYPDEWYYDSAHGNLYYWHNATGAPAATDTVVVPQKQILVNMTGTQWDPVQGVKLENIQYEASAHTYMERHAVPSAGDWALDRFAAIFLQGTESVVVDNCTLQRLGGNAVMVSGYNRNATVSNSDFSFIGGNAVAAWGYTNETATDPGRPGITLANYPQAGVDGTDGEHPVFTTVTSCTAREVGLYEKQSSFFIQAKTAQSVILGNVFFNGPRAGINANDGFGGGDDIGHNLVFSTCRESGDHGPFNSWDRQPYLTTVRTGMPDMIMQWREIHHNFFIDNYSPQENVDNDDGSCFYHTHDNFLVYGGRGMKNDFGGHDNRHQGNIYAYIGEGLGVCAALEGHEDWFTDNYAVLTGSTVGSPTCKAPAKTIMRNNSYFTQTGDVRECGGSLASWQSQGNEVGSSASTWPTDATLISVAKAKLGIM